MILSTNKQNEKATLLKTDLKPEFSENELLESNVDIKPGTKFSKPDQRSVTFLRQGSRVKILVGQFRDEIGIVSLVDHKTNWNFLSEQAPYLVWIHNFFLRYTRNELQRLSDS